MGNAEMRMGVNNMSMGQYEMQKGMNEFNTGTQLNNMANMGYGNMGFNGGMGYNGGFNGNMGYRPF